MARPDASAALLSKTHPVSVQSATAFIDDLYQFLDHATHIRRARRENIPKYEAVHADFARTKERRNRKAMNLMPWNSLAPEKAEPQAFGDLDRPELISEPLPGAT